jgi:biofilm PGA synthesis N-glycosyltransferase PgaC
MTQALSLLGSLDALSIVFLFWYTVLLEIPRYTLGAIIVAGATLWSPSRPASNPAFTLSVVLAGHNEAGCLRACVDGLAEQTIAREPGRMQVIVVDDGSTDGMADAAINLQREGRIDRVLRLRLRGGKSAAVNLGLSECSGDIVIIADIDTSFDRDAFEAILAYFADPRVGAVSGNIGVRNASINLLTRVQEIEYAIGIFLGRYIADTLGMLSIVSGAFGAFRRTAIESVGRQDVEVGEDADLTMKLRRAGWSIRFAPEALALTDVPESMPALISQRLRWDRGLITIWLRKFRGALDPRQSTFRVADALAILDVFIFQVLFALAFPAYLIWLWSQLGEFAWTVIGATLVGYAILDLVTFAAAAAVGIGSPLRLVLYLPLYTVMQISLMRCVRLIAIVQELVFRSSYRDPYVPQRIMRQAEVV